MSGQNKSEERKQRILDAALKVFAEKGFQDATVAAIARRARVSEGTIYEHFSNKENLLFHIPKAFTDRYGEVVRFHIEIIKGAANRLRAIVYLYLHMWKNHPDYAVLNLVILKTNQKFRETEGYRLIREGFQYISGIIQEGIDNGEFRPDIDPYIIRSVLMGAVDHVTVNWLLSDRKRDLLATVDPIVDVVMEGILSPETPGAEAPRPQWSRRRRPGANRPGKPKGD
ncbi:MAG: TetR/AcrR family transcriptional regulator [Thermodesulfobacteriota bacterium]